MDSRIIIGDKLEMIKIDTRISADPDRKQVTYASQVLDEMENGNMLVSMPIQEGKVIPLSIEQQLYATFYTKSGLLECEVEVAGRYKSGGLFLLELYQKTVLKKVQRREYFRLECRMQMEYRMISDAERIKLESGVPYEVDELENQWKTGVMLDLSGGGIRFVSSVQETKGSLVQVRFDISNGDEVEVIYAFATMLRSEKNPNNNAIYDQRLQFWRMQKTMRERIIRFIFETQRKKRSKEVGLD